MQVKILNDIQKDVICTLYTAKTHTIKKLATEYHTSPRTIGRVLEERGLATPVPRIKGEAYHALKLLQKHNLTPAQADQMLSKPQLTKELVVEFMGGLGRDEMDQLVRDGYAAVFERLYSIRPAPKDLVAHMAAKPVAALLKPRPSSIPAGFA
jgi:hypothetical protein